MSESAMWTIGLLVFLALSLFACGSMVSQMADCRKRGGQPIVDKFYQVACVPKM